MLPQTKLDGFWNAMMGVAIWVALVVSFVIGCRRGPDRNPALIIYQVQIDSQTIATGRAFLEDFKSPRTSQDLQQLEHSIKIMQGLSNTPIIINIIK